MIRSKPRAIKRRRRGAMAVEFALVAPLFLLMLGGIIEFGQAFRIQHALSTAARHGARSAVTAGATNSSVTQKVRNSCVHALGVASSDVTVVIAINDNLSGSLSNAVEGDSIAVTVSIRYSKAGVGFFADSFADSTLSSTCTLEHE